MKKGKVHMGDTTKEKEVESILKGKKERDTLEKVMYRIFLLFSLLSMVALAAITGYLFFLGAPAIFKVGLVDFLFSTQWQPTGSESQFGILYMIFTSLAGTIASVFIGVPIGVLTAIYLSEIGKKKAVKFLTPLIDLLASIPSVIYGLIGVIVVVPVLGMLEKSIFQGSETHQFTGGSNLLAAIIILAVMILPTIIKVSQSSLEAVDPTFKEASIALGATPVQTIFKVSVPAAKSGIATGIVLGIGRAIGEAMAIMMVSGNSVNIPLPFNSVRFLTTGIVSEMGYSTGLHREVLFSIGLVLFAFIMVINLVLNRILKKGGRKDGR